MAPIPEDNQEKPPQKDDSDLNSFSALNMGTNTMGSDSSDENDENYPDTSGYMLLPQEPDNDDNNNENENYLDDDDSYEYGTTPDSDSTRNSVINGTGNANIIPDHLPNEVIQSEGGASTPTVAASAASSLHPEFLAKFPDGKVPSYMQVPDIPSSHKDCLWNKKRTDKSMSTLESAEESNVLKAMSGFSLPVENVPEWARNMSEDEWNQRVICQIKPGQEKSNSGQDEQKTDAISEQTPQPQPDWVADFSES